MYPQLVNSSLVQKMLLSLYALVRFLLSRLPFRVDHANVQLNGNTPVVNVF
jgi:hypothetical protein